jgi:ABC-type polysaccharide/polyol phosphate export permease
VTTIYMSSALQSRRFAEIWCHRELLRNLVLRKLRVKYQRPALGFVWTPLNPLLAAAMLTGAWFAYLCQAARWCSKRLNGKIGAEADSLSTMRAAL